MSRLFWIDAPLAGRIAIAARPRGGDWLEDEITDWQRAGLRMVVCLLELDEVNELALQREVALCHAADIKFVSFPIADRGVPRYARDAAIIARAIASHVEAGGSVAVHCRAGIGRSGMMAAAALVTAGIDAERAFALIKVARGVEVPDTQEQRDWVLDFERRREF